MKKRILSMLFVLSPFMVPASVQAQWVVSDPGNLVQGIVNSCLLYTSPSPRD